MRDFPQGRRGSQDGTDLSVKAPGFGHRPSRFAARAIRFLRAVAFVQLIPSREGSDGPVFDKADVNAGRSFEASKES